MRLPRHLIAAVALTAFLTGCTGQADQVPVDLASTATVSAVRVSKARDLLPTIAVKGRAPKTRYSREQFGPAWTDDNDASMGHNGCDTRNDILARDLGNKKLRSGSDCVVVSGTLADVYNTGPGGKGLHVIKFVRGRSTSDAVQIDHIVPLSDAWQKGAAGWNKDKRVRLANDPRNLQAVDGPTNEAKSDSDAATWLPKNRGYWCAYGVRIVEVKADYGLWVTSAEHDALVNLIDTCPAR